MIGASRESFAGLRQRLDERRGEPGFPAVPEQLLAVADLVSRDKSLRNALADDGQPQAARAGLVANLLGARVDALTVNIVADAAAQRWSSSADLLEALEGIGAQAYFLQAQAEGTLDAIQSELFEVSQILVGSADLAMALTNPAISSGEKATLVESLLRGKADPTTTAVCSYGLSHLRGRRSDEVMEAFMDLAAEQQGRAVAEVRVARALDDEQKERMIAALSRIRGRHVHLNVAVDPSVLGGVSVRIGDEVIDGTVAAKLEMARRALSV